MTSTKGDAKVPHKGKDFEIARWEAEVRSAVESKKKVGATLTKQQQALVQAQLVREAAVRQRVDVVKANLVRGLAFVRSIVAAGVLEFRVYISSVAELLLEGALRKGSLLVGASALETYLVRSLSAPGQSKPCNRIWQNVAPSGWIISAYGLGSLLCGAWR